MDVRACFLHLVSLVFGSTDQTNSMMKETAKPHRQRRWDSLPSKGAKAPYKVPGYAPLLFQAQKRWFELLHRTFPQRKPARLDMCTTSSSTINPSSRTFRTETTWGERLTVFVAEWKRICNANTRTRMTSPHSVIYTPTRHTTATESLLSQVSRQETFANGLERHERRCETANDSIRASRNSSGIPTIR